jgi:hypothetical protein
LTVQRTSPRERRLHTRPRPPSTERAQSGHSERFACFDMSRRLGGRVTAAVDAFHRVSTRPLPARPRVLAGRMGVRVQCCRRMGGCRRPSGLVWSVGK